MADDQEQVVENTEVQYSEAEQQAMANGWVPKDKWDGEPDDWVPARQFNRNGELFGRINSYKNKILNLERSVSELVKHNEKIYETGFKDGLDSLKAEKKQALREGDAERVVEIEEEIEKLQENYEERKKEFDATVKSQAQVQTNPVWEEWLTNNSWYEMDAGLHGYADGVAKELVESAQRVGKQVEYDKLLKEVSRKVKERFPDKFGVTRPSSATNKSDDNAPAKGRSSSTEKYQLTDMEEQIFQTLSKSGMTREKYVEDLKKVKARKG